MAKLTKEEKMTLHSEKCKEYEEKGYTVKNKTVTALEGNLFGLIIPIPAVIFLYVASRMVCKRIYPQNDTNYNEIILILIIVALIFLHELTHGAVAAMYCEGGWKSIKFGFNVEGLNPYCLCTKSLNVKHYRQVLLAPAFVEGVLPVIIGMLTGSYMLITAGAFMFWTSGGDILIYLMLRKENKDDLVADHPYLIGCTVLSKKE